MEKVKLTREQANAIEYALQEVDEYKGNPDRLLRHASMNNVNFRNELHLLDTIDIVTLAKALYIGYEVEPEFKVGDWVVWDEIKIIGQLVEIDSVLRVDSIDYDVPQSVKLDELRHATPSEIAEEKERRWWARHGRNLWELRKGDLLKDNHFGKMAEVREVEDKYYLIGAITSYEPLDFIKRNYTVVCFAEQRLDWDGD